MDPRVVDGAHGTAEGEEGVDRGEALDGVDPDTAQRFASAFLSTIVTAERAADIVARLVGPVVRVGPEPVGPGGLATATARADRARSWATDSTLGPSW